MQVFCNQIQYLHKRSDKDFLQAHICRCCWRYDLHCIMICQSQTFFPWLINKSQKLFFFKVHVQCTLMKHIKPLLLPSCHKIGSTGYGFPLPHTSHHKVEVHCVAFAMIGLKADIVTSMASSVLIVPLPWPGQVFT